MKTNLKMGNKKTQFTSENQPTGEAKSFGKKKKKLLKEIANQLLSGQAKENFRPIAEYLGIDVELTTEPLQV